MNKFGLFGVKIGAVMIDHVVDRSVKPGVSYLTHRPNGSPYTTFSSIQAANPDVPMNTKAIKKALDMIGTTGDEKTAIEVYYQKRKHGGTFETGLAHVRKTVSKAIVYPVSLSCDAKGSAVLSMRAVAISADGTSSPVTTTHGVALSGTTAVDELYAIKSVKIGSNTVSSVTGIEIDFGLAWEFDADGSNPYPQFASLHTHAPTITINTQDITVLDAAEAELGTEDSVEIKLRKRKAGGIFDTANEITLTATKCSIRPGPYGGDENDHGHSLTCVAMFDGTNDPFAYSVT